MFTAVFEQKYRVGWSVLKAKFKKSAVLSFARIIFTIYRFIHLQLIVNVLPCSVNSELKHKTNDSHASVSGPHAFSCPTRELEIEINCVQYCYSFSSLVVVLNTFTSHSHRAARLERDDTDVFSWTACCVQNCDLLGT